MAATIPTACASHMSASAPPDCDAVSGVDRFRRSVIELKGMATSGSLFDTESGDSTVKTSDGRAWYVKRCSKDEATNAVALGRLAIGPPIGLHVVEGDAHTVVSEKFPTDLNYFLMGTRHIPSAERVLIAWKIAQVGKRFFQCFRGNPHGDMKTPNLIFDRDTHDVRIIDHEGGSKDKFTVDALSPERLIKLLTQGKETEEELQHADRYALYVAMHEVLFSESFFCPEGTFKVSRTQHAEYLLRHRVSPETVFRAIRGTFDRTKIYPPTHRTYITQMVFAMLNPSCDKRPSFDWVSERLRALAPTHCAYTSPIALRVQHIPAEVITFPKVEMLGPSLDHPDGPIQRPVAHQEKGEDKSELMKLDAAESGREPVRIASKTSLAKKERGYSPRGILVVAALIIVVVGGSWIYITNNKE